MLLLYHNVIDAYLQQNNYRYLLLIEYATLLIIESSLNHLRHKSKYFKLNLNPLVPDGIYRCHAQLSLTAGWHHLMPWPDEISTSQTSEQGLQHKRTTGSSAITIEAHKPSRV